MCLINCLGLLLKPKLHVLNPTGKLNKTSYVRVEDALTVLVQYSAQSLSCRTAPLPDGSMASCLGSDLYVEFWNAI